MTVRVAPLWNVMSASSPDDPPSAAAVVDDGDDSVRVVYRGTARSTFEEDFDDFAAVHRPGSVEMYLEDADGDRLAALVAVGMINTMYVTHDDAVTDHGTMQEAVDHVYGVLWPPEGDVEEGSG